MDHLSERKTKTKTKKTNWLRKKETQKNSRLLMFRHVSGSSASARHVSTHCVLSVKAALVMEVGRLRPLVISRHIFLLMTSTKPPFSVTSL